MKTISRFMLAAALLSLVACKQDAGSETARAAETTALAPATAPTQGVKPPYVIKDSSSVQLLESGVQLYVIEAGSGAIPAPTSHVFINYHGMLTDGTVFDSSFDRGTPADFALTQLIRGWQIGLTKVKSGSKVKLVVPPEVGYGAQGSATIPPNSTLIFDIELISTY
jgi:FKBP-type peptidyl-prolyl cis-trans isomerase FklB